MDQTWSWNNHALRACLAWLGLVAAECWTLNIELRLLFDLEHRIPLNEMESLINKQALWDHLAQRMK